MRGFQNGFIFLNLANQFQRYLNVSALKRGVFLRQDLKRTYISEMALKEDF